MVQSQKSTRLRTRSLRGQFIHTPIHYGKSVFGSPLLYFPTPKQPIALGEKSTRPGLILAGTHGDENASMVALSCALRSIHPENQHHHVILAMNPDGCQLGTRANANGVDLNRNFASENWQNTDTVYRWNSQADIRDVIIGTGETGNSEPETIALCQLIEELNPAWIVSFHDPLGCIDDPTNSQLGQWLAQEMELPLVGDVGYQTPGSFGSWCAERDLLCVTVELPPISADEACERYLELLTNLLTKDSFVPTEIV